MSSFFACPRFPAGEWNVAVPASIAFVIPQRPLVIALRSTSIKDKIQAAREEVSGKDEKARQEPEQGRAAPPGRR